MSPRPQPTTANISQEPGTPLNSWILRLSSLMGAPATRSRIVRETRISPAPPPRSWTWIQAVTYWAQVAHRARGAGPRVAA
jgi:hypothetical protein